MDVYETSCGICLSLLAEWPKSEELATSNLAPSELPCGHCFHAECIHAARAQIQLDSVTGRIEAVAEPLVQRVCPMCRAPWSPATVNERILADFEDANTTDDDDGNYGSDEEDDVRVTPANVPHDSKHWTKYVDPNTGKLFWVTDDVSEHFFEESGEWKCYVTLGGLLWWCKVGNEASWFYERTGSASLL